MEKITGVNNEKVKRTVKLISSSKERKETGLFAVEGLRLCYDILRSDRKPEEVYFTQRVYEKYPKETEELIEASVNAYEITEEISNKISDTKNSQGIFCVLKAIDKTDDNYKIYFKGNYIILDNLQDPSNVGAALRTAEALGIDAVVLYNCCDIYNPKVLRSAMGAVFRIKTIESANLKLTVEEMKNAGLKVYATTPREDATDITKADMSAGVACIVGNEAQGISDEIMSCCDDRITVKMSGRAESLNASAAASIIMWEMMKGTN